MAPKEQQEIERALTDIGIGSICDDNGIARYWAQDRATLQQFLSVATADKPWVPGARRD